MKKRLKKMLAVICLLTLVFTFTVKPKKSEAVMTEMFLSSMIATGGIAAAAPYIIGAAGILAVGGVIAGNWETVEYYGNKVIEKMGGSVPIDEVDGVATVVYSPAMKLAMAQAVDDMPATIDVTSAITIPDISFSGVIGNYQTRSIGAVPANHIVKIAFDYTLNSTNPNYAANIEVRRFTTTGSQTLIPNGTFTTPALTSKSGSAVVSYTTGVAYDDFKYYFATQQTATMSNIKVDVYPSGGTPPVSATYNTSDTFGTAGDNVNARLLGMNAVIADNQAVGFDTNANIANATLSDISEISNLQLNESQTQTGILAEIWSGILSLINTINAASVSASASINANMDQLWQDAGAIWSGMADSLTNIQTDVNAKIGAMQTAMSGGIDNIRIDIGTMMDNLSAGIDSFAASAAANWASWGQLTLDGIDAGIGAITSGLSTAWTNTTTAIETAATATTTAINEGIGAITTGLTTITDWITGFPSMFFSWFVPPDFSFLGPLITQATNDLEDKVGSLPSLEDITSAITIQEKSIYEIEITVLGHTYRIIPLALKPTIDGARPFLTAAVNLTSITFLIHRNKRELFK